MPLEHERLLTSLGLPDAHRLVVGATGQPFAVGAPGHRIDRGRVPPDRRDFGNLQARVGIPEAYGSVGATTSEALAVGAPGQGEDRGRAPLEGKYLLTVFRVPNLRRLIGAS